MFHNPSLANRAEVSICRAKTATKAATEVRLQPRIDTSPENIMMEIVASSCVYALPPLDGACFASRSTSLGAVPKHRSRQSERPRWKRCACLHESHLKGQNHPSCISEGFPLNLYATSSNSTLSLNLPDRFHYSTPHPYRTHSVHTVSHRQT